ncbi:cytochrome P450 [Pyrrhoderma noxium]|uniref:Cytochrome P450 n=1 Tax=Pyrrhoderma noxium TaxID=2282107 RepID=A0A286UH96_9AGAM|nr:cytochrome P450 [Pyrrhoderma noxium]
MLDLPKSGQHEWLHWAKHRRQYGPISSLSIMGHKLIIINDYTSAMDLLDKRSLNFSDRPDLTFAGVMIGLENTLPFIHYGEDHRMMRKCLHQVIGTKQAVQRYYDREDVEVRRYLYKTLQDPSRFRDHLRSLSGALILSIAYGYQVEHATPDPLVRFVEYTMHKLHESAIPGKWLVDIIPILRFLPNWIPGTGFKDVARDCAQLLDEITQVPYAFTKRQMENGLAQPSLTQELLDEYRGAPNSHEEFIIKWSANAIYGGGADTTVSASISFYYWMLQYPEIHRRAQAEIDAVVGTDRLPTFADREYLPYVNALIKEVLRCSPIIPINLPHKGIEDTIYNGYLIPKGALILVNIYSLLHDPDTYKNPDEFCPERYLGENPELDPSNMVFGFGRRVCPGRELADHTLFLTIASSLSVFDVLPPTGPDGKPIKQNFRYQTGLVVGPEHFEANIKLRPGKTEEFLSTALLEQPYNKGDSEALKDVPWARRPKN